MIDAEHMPVPLFACENLSRTFDAGDVSESFRGAFGSRVKIYCFTWDIGGQGPFSYDNTWATQSMRFQARETRGLKVASLTGLQTNTFLTVADQLAVRASQGKHEGLARFDRHSLGIKP